MLVKDLLGAKLDDEGIERVVARAGGNAFFLEELVRAADQGGVEAPETVVAMIGARLEDVSEHARIGELERPTML